MARMQSNRWQYLPFNNYYRILLYSVFSIRLKQTEWIATWVQSSRIQKRLCKKNEVFKRKITSTVAVVFHSSIAMVHWFIDSRFVPLHLIKADAQKHFNAWLWLFMTLFLKLNVEKSSTTDPTLKFSFRNFTNI